MHCQCTQKVPNMFSSRSVSIARRNWYLTKKHPALSASLGRPESIFFHYTAANFSAFLQHVLKSGTPFLWIYFAETKGNLSLVYATGDHINNASQIYYLLDQHTYTSISRQNALSMVKDYQTHKVPILNGVINQQNVSETFCITHAMSDIQELKDEIACQQPSGIKAYIASYLLDDAYVPDIHYDNKLFVEFSFTEIKQDGSEQDCFIDDCPNFHARPKKDIREDLVDSNNILEAITYMGDFNNGSLCPPCPNCVGALVPPPGC